MDNLYKNHKKVLDLKLNKNIHRLSVNVIKIEITKIGFKIAKNFVNILIQQN